MQISGNRAVVNNQFSENMQQLTKKYNEIRFLEPLITADMNKIAETNKTHFAGLEYSVKTASSVEDKLRRAEKTFDDSLDSVGKAFNLEEKLYSLKDVIRYTEICKHEDIFYVAKSTITALENKGYVLSGVSNYYANPYPDTGYKGLHLNFVSPYGQEIELQIHSQESFDAKQKGHELYEKIRSVSSHKVDKEKFKEEILDIHNSVSIPKNHLLIEDLKLRNKKEIIAERKHTVHIEIDSSDINTKPCATAYSVFVNGDKVLTGFENTQTDNSVTLYQNNIKDGYAKLCSLDAHGNEIATHESKSYDINLEKAMYNAKNSECTHNEWMDKNFTNKEIKDMTDLFTDKISDKKPVFAISKDNDLCL